MTWSNDFIGIPWAERGASRDGCTCWGLVRLVYAERCGLAVPDYRDVCADIANAEAVGGVFERYRNAHPWIAVDPVTIRPFDILVFRRGVRDAHVGIATGLKDRMLHITSRADSCLADYSLPLWASRLSGVYRHHALLTADAG